MHPQYKRVLLKISGESFCKPNGFGIEPEHLDHIAKELEMAVDTGVQIAVVVGGGNIIRGAELAKQGHIQQATADHMGMLGTVINALALKEKLLTMNVDCRVMSAIEIRAVAEIFIRSRAVRHVEKGATELDCDLLLKATKVDGVYTADPKKDPNATRYDVITYREAMQKNLRVMDMTAIAMCNEHEVPVLIFDFRQSGNIARAVRGEKIGTLLHHG
jgi:uridylate kinase